MAQAGYEHLGIAAGIGMVSFDEASKGATALAALFGREVSAHLLSRPGNLAPAAGASDIVDVDRDRVGPDQWPQGGAHLIADIGKKRHPAGHHVNLDHPIDDPDCPGPPAGQMGRQVAARQAEH
jgi:hypothetical protein